MPSGRPLDRVNWRSGPEGRLSQLSRNLINLCGKTLVALTVGYVVLGLLPFYGNGIHLHSYQEIYGSFVDVKDYPPFSWLSWTWFGGPAQGLAMIFTAYAPLLSIPLSPLLLGTVVSRWRSLRRSKAVFWTAVCLINAAVMGLTWQAHMVILTWLVD